MSDFGLSSTASQLEISTVTALPFDSTTTELSAADAASNVESRCQEVIDKLLEAVDGIFDDVMEDRGNKGYKFSTTDLTAGGSVMTEDAENATVTTDEGIVTVPTSGAGGCNLKVVFSKKNPKASKSTSKNVKSNSLMIKFSNCSAANDGTSTSRRRRRRRSTSTTSDTVEFFELSLPTSAAEPAFVNDTPQDKWLMFYHSFSISSENDLIQVQISPFNKSHEFEVFLQTDYVPSPENSSLTLQLPIPFANLSEVHGQDLSGLTTGSSTAWEYQTMFYLPRGFLNVSGTHYFGVRRKGCYKDESANVMCSDPSLKYNFSMVRHTCQRYEEKYQMWLPLPIENCQPLERGTPSKPVFRSNLFGSLGVGLNLTPNLIDFGAIFSNFSERLAEAAVVTATVIALWCLFIPLAVVLRRMDKRDTATVSDRVNDLSSHISSELLEFTHFK
jgi:hypothetical protein